MIPESLMRRTSVASPEKLSKLRQFNLVCARAIRKGKELPNIKSDFNEKWNRLMDSQNNFQEKEEKTIKKKAKEFLSKARKQVTKEKIDELKGESQIETIEYLEKKLARIRP